MLLMLGLTWMPLQLMLLLNRKLAAILQTEAKPEIKPKSLRSQDSSHCRLLHLDEHLRQHPMSASYLNQSHQGFVTQKMGLINIIKPVSTTSKQRHQYNSESSSILKNKFLKKIGNTDNRTQGSWVRNANSISELCRPLMWLNLTRLLFVQSW